jgi:ferrochelatase
VEKPALLLINLGTPSSPEPKEVGNYLTEFLMDPYVIDIPWVFRWIFVHLFIVPRRSKESSALYKNIWSDSGSPLLVNSYKLLERLKPLVPDREVELAMRYGTPSIARALENLKARGVENIDILPLYPQYATSSVETVLVKCREEITKMGFSGKVNYYKEFYNHEAYQTALAATVREVLEEKKPDHLLYSYHGLPEHQVAATCDACKADASSTDNFKEHSSSCYRAQCYRTSELLDPYLKDLNVPSSVAFQSRVGRRPWLKPFTDHKVAELAASGVKRLAVACPAFTADCLETLEEIEYRIAEDFIAAGGKEVFLVPSLNDRDDWVCALKVLLDEAPKLNLFPSSAG